LVPSLDAKTAREKGFYEPPSLAEEA